MDDFIINPLHNKRSKVILKQTEIDIGRVKKFKTEITNSDNNSLYFLMPIAFLTVKAFLADNKKLINAYILAINISLLQTIFKEGLAKVKLMFLSKRRLTIHYLHSEKMQSRTKTTSIK